MTTKTYTEDELRNLPWECLHLLQNGSYSLYEVEIAGKPEVRYVLRMGQSMLWRIGPQGEDMGETEETDEVKVVAAR